MEVGGTREEEKMEKLWSGANGVGMVEAVEKAGPKEEEPEKKVRIQLSNAPSCKLLINMLPIPPAPPDRKDGILKWNGFISLSSENRRE